METIDDVVAERAAGFIAKQHAAGKPVFVRVNFTHMHFRTHTKPESVGQAGRWQSRYHDTMIDHDRNVGTVLDKPDELGIADDTIVFHSTDNGPHMNTWLDGDVTALRYDNRKLVFMEQRVRSTLQIWLEPYTVMRAPKLYNLRTDPYERADVTSNTYYDWWLDHAFLLVPAQAYVARFLQTFREFPPRQETASFSLKKVLEKLKESPGSR